MNVIVEKEVSGTVIRYTVESTEVIVYCAVKEVYELGRPNSLVGYTRNEIIGYSTDFEKANKAGGTKVAAQKGYQLPDGTLFLWNQLSPVEKIL